MAFDSYLDQAWTDHATNPKSVALGFEIGIEQLEKEDQVSALAHLVAHVTGDHLGDWQRGTSLIERLQKLEKFDLVESTRSALARYKAILELCDMRVSTLDSFNTSDRIRVFAGAASALGGNSQIERAFEYLNKAVALLNFEVPNSDPAYRSMAVVGNTLASTLEDKAERSPQEIELMLFAASVGRKYWAIAGTWKEIERAEYRLASSHLKSKSYEKGLEHAKLCIEVCVANHAPALEFFYGYEILAKIENAMGNSEDYKQAFEQAQKYFAQMSVDDQKWGRKSLDNISKL